MDDYNLPSIYKQTMALAKTMVADNPKLSIDEALSKAGKQLGKQNKWETQTKPGLEKTFGPLQPSTFNQNAVQRLRTALGLVSRSASAPLMPVPYRLGSVCVKLGSLLKCVSSALAGFLGLISGRK